MSLLAIALRLDPEFFTPQIDGRHNNLRLLHYPPASRDGTNSRLQPHTDDGSVNKIEDVF